MTEELHHERENYFRHSMLVVDHSKDAFNSLIDKDLRGKNITFENFLDQKKHEIYHCCYHEKCCKCLTAGNLPSKRTKRLTNVQFDLLYYKKNNPYCSITGNVPHLCCIDVKSGISTEIIEITLSRWLIVNYCSDVFWKECLQGLSLEQFLNDNVHLVYHLWQFSTPCCSCPYRFQLPSRQVINDKHLKMMFDGCSSPPACRKRKYMGNTNCICPMSAKQGIRENDLHPELQQKLLGYMVSARQAVETIIEIRNNTYGHIQNTRISNEDYKKIRIKTEKALLDIGQFCGKISQVKAAINDVQQKPLDHGLMLKYTSILSESIEAKSYFKELEAKQRQLEDNIQKNKEDNTRALNAFSDKLEKNMGLHHFQECGSKYETDVRCISKKNSPEQRFIRCAMVAVQEIPKIMQEIMKQSAMTPVILYNLIQNDEQFQNIMPTAEQNVYGLQSLLKDGYTKLHVTLIFNIVRYYSNIFIPTPKQGWDSDPNLEDAGIGDDAQRMRKMMNKIRTTPSKALGKREFEEFFTRIYAIGARIDEYFKLKSCVTSFQKDIHDMLLRPIDKAMEEKILEEIVCLTDYFIIESGKNEVCVYRGKTLKDFFNRMADCDANTTAPITMRFPGIKGDPEIASLVNTLQDQINNRSLPIKLDGAAVGSLIIFLSVENNVFKSDIETREVLSSFIDHFIKVTNLQQWLCQPKNIVEAVITNEYFWNNRYIREENQSQRNDSAGCVLLNLEVNKAGVHCEEHCHNLTFKNEGNQPENESELIAVIRPIKTVFIEGSIDLEENAKEKEHVEHKSEISETVQQQNWENFLNISILVDDHLKAILVSLIAFYLREKHYTFEQFLNRNQHKIYHMCYNLGRCCRCSEDVSQKQNDRVLFPIHMGILLDKSNKMPGHKINHGPNFCCSFAKSGISTDVLDVVLAECLLVNFCADVFWYSCLQFQGISFENFLNQNKHLLYHMWQNNTRCCQCSSPLQIPLNCQVVNEQQWTDMFTASSHSTHSRHRSPSTHCICSISAKPGIRQVDLDPVLQHTLLKYCCPTLQSVETLMTIRRNVYGHIEKAQITDLDYTKYKTDIDSAMLNLTIICDKDQGVKIAFNDLKHDHVDDSLLEYKDRLSDRIDPSACEYCNILAAFIGNKCQRCTNSERKWGAPKTCEQCKQKCAFERTDNSTKVDGKLMCWLCTVAYKRVLAKAKIRQEVSRKNFGSQKKSSEKSEKSEKSEQIDKFDSIMNKTTDENKPGPKTENTSSAVPESQESTGSQDEKSSERKPHKHHKHKHHHHHHHHKHKHHHSQKSSEPNTPTAAAAQTPPSKKPRLETNSSTNGVTPTKSGSSLSSITGLNMSSLTDRPTEDPHSSEHLIALQLLQEQMEGLKKTLQQKEQQLLEKEKKLTELKAQNYESEKEWRIKFTNVQKKLTETNENNQIKVRELMKQISTLSKGGKKLKGYVPSPLAL